jgi:hypothetical protein
MHLLTTLFLLAAGNSLAEELQQLFLSLPEKDRAICLKSYDDPDRKTENFTPGERKGLVIKSLSEEQYGRLENAMRLFFSEEGLRDAVAVTKQSHPDNGLRSYYMNFFGDPSKDKQWAFRVSEHHLTILHFECEPHHFGPVLLGANPPLLWRSQEEAAIKCFSKLSEAERKAVLVEGRGLSGEALGQRGAAIGTLSSEAKAAAMAMIAERLNLFGVEEQKKLRAILDSQGGVDRLKIAFFGPMKETCEAGGRSDWKIEGPSFLCDYEASRGHIHMTLRGEVHEH